MNILIVGRSGSGKSNLGDIIRNAIFKADSNAMITSGDPDRSIKTFGHGSNAYNVSVRQLKDDETIGSLTKEEMEEQDIVIYINSGGFHRWFREVYTK